ncbi:MULTISPECIES: zinc ABC transporter substrate-binding protein [unclassified Paenibacillus]|uniref:metal ABC transporter solute-binding protein, Zn/Mn family n=1 Tax=unclassified Paenibacillus TaxID=185978 RepID=UPI001B78F1C2|nr:MULTISPECIES: zinc ABC transporter substrate-binding protein [unclassified Paenibacillus]MBP1154344.1 manganese/zinc/iron transport system substrate-binding protein [Paenibacillus sp. PvP091]MBP1170272.1 manganese/zinc/iron transport system substrate-binding protein [Paenibacillus sp. PvR098]MBP2441300.1 manganese/zinc/iron transport system substrate-binding protein [Paenibacillus sp. PvP052]
METKSSMLSFKRFIMTILFLGLAVTLAACGGSKEVGGNTADEGKIKVTSTIGMIHDLVKQVGGEHVEAYGLMQPGVDPHLYKASQGDLKKLEQADIIFYNGLHLEGKMIDIFEQMAKSKPTVAVTKNIAESELLASDEEGMEHDPHVWFNVQHWISATETIRDELVKVDAAHADSYKSNANAYIKELEEMDQYAKAQLATIPQQQRVLVTAHDAFGYFGKAYGVEVRGLQGMNTASEYGSKDVSDLRDYLVANQIKAVFVESSVPKKSIEAVIEGAKRQGHEIQIGGELFSDAMGEEGTPVGTYLGMVRHNVDTIVKALK